MRHKKPYSDEMIAQADEEKKEIMLICNEEWENSDRDWDRGRRPHLISCKITQEEYDMILRMAGDKGDTFTAKIRIAIDKGYDAMFESGE